MANPLTNQRPGSVVSSRQVAVKDFYVTSTNQDFTFMQPQNSIIESVHVFFDGATEIDGYGSTTAGDMTLVLGTAAGGVQIATSTTIIDASADDTIDDGAVVSCTAQLTAAATGSAATSETVLHGRLACGDADTITGTNKLQVHIAFRQF